VDFANPDMIRRILDSCRTIAVVGLSGNSSRPSHRVAAYMQQQGYTIIPINPNERTVLGERAYATLSDVPGKIDLVTVFRRSDEAGAVVDEAIKIGARAVWLQEGIVNDAAAKRTHMASLLAVMDCCWLKDHRRQHSERRSF
jgi:predicted CoA-binding protein